MMDWFSNRLARRLPIFYGYVMLPVAMLMQIGTSPGQTFAISAFTPALLESLQLTESRLGLAYMLGTLTAAIPLSIVGPTADRWGLKRTSLVVVFALAAACYGASQVSGFYGLLVVFFFLRFLGQGSLTLLAGNTTSMWFRNRIGRVSAIISIGTAATFAWVPGMLADAIDKYGWRLTYQYLAGCLIATLVPTLLLVFRNRPEDLGQHVDGLTIAPSVSSSDAEAIKPEEDQEINFTLQLASRHKSFYVLAATNAVWAMIGTGIVFYLFTLCADRGFDSQLPSSLFKTFGFSMLAMQFAGSVAADFLRLNRLFGFGASLLSAGLLVLLWGDSSVAMHTFSALFGGGQGMLIATSAVIWVRFYGRTHLGSIRGAVWCATVAGSGIGPLIMGRFKEFAGTYDPAIILFLVLMTPLSLAAWWITSPPSPTTLPSTH